MEAFAEGIPVACSSATSLPEYAGDAALLFEPTVNGIVDALTQMHLDGKLRDELLKRGNERRTRFSWDSLGRRYRALYRSAAGERLTNGDLSLLRQPVESSVSHSSQ